MAVLCMCVRMHAWVVCVLGGGGGCVCIFMCLCVPVAVCACLCTHGAVWFYEKAVTLSELTPFWPKLLFGTNLREVMRQAQRGFA